MTMTKNLGMLAVAGLLFAAANGARAAGAYTLTCDAARSGAITVQLTGFNVAVTATGEGAPTGAATGMSSGRRETKFALTVQTDSGKDYETLLSMLEDNEVLRSCKLIDGEVSGSGMTGKDNWTQEAVTKGKNKSKTNAPASTSGGGGLEWILTNATVTSVTVNAGPNATGVPTTTIQATIDAQKFSFTT
ncbi:MAG: hypothetical protein ABSD70_08905 [Terracidiphilus sp.]|jgi:hypothetical protein